MWTACCFSGEVDCAADGFATSEHGLGNLDGIEDDDGEDVDDDVSTFTRSRAGKSKTSSGSREGGGKDKSGKADSKRGKNSAASSSTKR